MIEQLPVAEEPEWLSRVHPATIQDSEFPLDDILRDSFYYPASSLGRGATADRVAGYFSI